MTSFGVVWLTTVADHTFPMFFFFSSPKRSCQLNSRIVNAHFQSKRSGITEKWLQKRDVTWGSLRSTKRRQRQRNKFYILDGQKQKLCTPFTCFLYFSAFLTRVLGKSATSQKKLLNGHWFRGWYLHGSKFALESSPCLIYIFQNLSNARMTKLWKEF